MRFWQRSFRARNGGGAMTWAVRSGQGRGSRHAFRYGIALSCLATSMLAAASADAQQGLPPPAVIAQPVQIEAAGEHATFSGVVEAIDKVEILARVEGFIQAIEFDGGDHVARGDVLFRIESRPYDAAVAAAKAHVAQAEARRDNAEQERGRQERLSERGVSAEARLEDAQAAAAIAEADVSAAEAALEQALIEQSYTTIEAPFSGEISEAFYSEGALVRPGGAALARLVRTDPVRVVFSIPDRLLIALRSEEAAGRPTDAGDLDFRLMLSNGDPYPIDGQLEFIANQADPATGTIAVRLAFENPDRILVPGQFVDVEIGESNPPEMPIVPQTAVLQDREGRFVFVVNEDSTVSERRIETGARVGDGWAVLKGLDGGEQVVTQGVQRLADGVPVRVTGVRAKEPG